MLFLIISIVIFLTLATIIDKKLNNKSLKFRFNVFMPFFNIIWFVYYKLWNATIIFISLSVLLNVIYYFLDPIDIKLIPKLNDPNSIVWFANILINIGLFYIFLGIYSEKIYYLKYRNIRNKSKVLDI